MPFSRLKFLTIFALFMNQGGYLNFTRPRMVMSPDDGKGGAGGGGGDDKDNTIAALKAENEKFKADLEALKNPKPDPNKDADLQAKAAKEREENEKNNANSKRLENALKFNLGVSQFVKENKDILTADMEGILKAAEKENYDTAQAKANAVKVGMIGTFFSVQANIDFLTPAQKSQLEDFMKLTKNGKEEKAEHVFENIFEPAIEMLKKVKKAEELGKAKSGFASGSSVENDYKQRLINQAKKGHLKEKV